MNLSSGRGTVRQWRH